jgi:hypothetical protein
MLFAACETGAVQTAMTFYIRDIGADSNITELQSASLLSIMAFVGFPCTILAGFLLENVAVYHMIAFSFLLQGVALI